MVLQDTKHRRRPPIIVEGAPPSDDLTIKALHVLDAAKVWDDDPDGFGDVLLAPRLGWAGPFGAAASTGLEPSPKRTAMVTRDRRLVFLA